MQARGLTGPRYFGSVTTEPISDVADLASSGRMLLSDMSEYSGTAAVRVDIPWHSVISQGLSAVETQPDGPCNLAKAG